MAPLGLQASSHREAPGITERPKVDGTDFYVFRSYEAGREAFVTLVANYIPLQDPYGGPNYFTLDPRARYEIKIDNDAAARTYDIRIPGCRDGRMFVGQRKDPFVVNLGEVFDLVNVSNPLGPVNDEADDLADKNVTSLILELPISCVAGSRGPVIGAWTTASLPKHGKHDTFVQVSRLSNPLVNEVVFGGAGVKAPTLFPRTDLVAAFLTGVPGLNANGSVAEMIRLNTDTLPKPAASQNNLGVIGGDVAGFPNGRRPGDAVVDIALRVVMGKLLPLADAPSGQLPFTDGALVDASHFSSTFPYLKTPIPGSPNDTP